MSFWSMLYSVLLMPIQLLFEVVFSMVYAVSNSNEGVAIIALSLAINLLILPLYRRADAMQEEERELEKRLHPGVAHIKKTFRGNERTMMLQTYYRQNHYSPVYALRGLTSLLLEIPFFIAAYRFLSELSLLQGKGFGPIADLGMPDGMLNFGSFSVNLLPILMTAINVISTVIYTRGCPLKTKLQLYAMAAFFLVFLYNSPSGLVFYWTLNNLFSLVKTIFYKLKDPKKALRRVIPCCGALVLIYGIAEYSHSGYLHTILFCAGVAVLSCLPLILPPIRKRIGKRLPHITSAPDKKLFLTGALLLTVLTGLLIPSAVISASPQEFIVFGNYLHPVWYIVSALLIAVGFFFLWLGVFYWLFSPKARVILERVMLILGVSGIVNYLLFGGHLGTISAELTYDRDITYPVWQILLNIAVVILVAVAVLFVTAKKAKITRAAVTVAAVAMVCMVGVNTFGIFRAVSEVDVAAYSADESLHLTLSREGRNVIVLMLDRAPGEYIPYILSEHPELEKQYDGFTYYANTISYGSHTNLASPALYGGYEYTPVEMNRRSSEKLEEKHNESLKVMPKLFLDEDYRVSVYDPPYAGYQLKPDMSIYDELPGVEKYVSFGALTDKASTDEIIARRNRNFFCHSVVKIAPVCLQSLLYYGGGYCQMTSDYVTLNNSYEVLKNLPRLTQVSDGGEESFILMANETTHNTVMFSDEKYMEPTYDLYHNQSHGDLTLGGRTLKLRNRQQIGSYQCSTAALLRLGEWFDYLREQGVYDNTRIILVADHGFAWQHLDEFMLDSTAYDENSYHRYGDAEAYFPLLMVKDFDARGGVTTSDVFMTNADVPTLATSGVIDHPVNPYTKKPINSDEKTAHVQYISGSGVFSVDTNNGSVFLPSRWYSVHDSIWKRENWQLVTEDGVLP